jgi:hypothetical protein
MEFTREGIVVPWANPVHLLYASYFHSINCLAATFQNQGSYVVHKTLGSSRSLRPVKANSLKLSYQELHFDILPVAFLELHVILLLSLDSRTGKVCL